MRQCASSDDTLSAEWEPSSSCEAPAAAPRAEVVDVPTVGPPKRKRGRPAGSKSKETVEDFEAFEVSVTITGGSCDIDAGLLDVMETFLKELCLAGMFALERGGTVSHLHLQVGPAVSNFCSVAIWSEAGQFYILICVFYVGCTAYEGEDCTWYHPGNQTPPWLGHFRKATCRQSCHVQGHRWQ